jgi:hypothetical protein
MTTTPTLFDTTMVPLCDPLRQEDICFNRHGGAETSMLADRRVRKSKDRALVYGYVKAAGSYGHTLDELSILLDRPCNCISGRLTELRKSGEIVTSDFTRFTRTRSRARVYVVAR